MLKNITIGQYFPGNSPVHRLDPRIKLILSVVYIVMLFMAGGALSLSVSVLCLLIIYPLSKIPFGMIMRSLKPIIPIILFTAVLNVFFVPSENPLWQWGVLAISAEGITTAVVMCVRILALIAGTSLLTYTTTPITLTDAIEHLFSPLKKLHMPVHEITMMMTIALRFIPALIEETDKIMSAQKARGADMESGTVFQRVKALIPILVPLFVSAFRRADELALAMESRCYHGGEGRTRMRQMKLGVIDLWATLFMLAMLAITIFVNNSYYQIFILFGSVR